MGTHWSELKVPDSELEYDADLTYRWHGALFTGIGFDYPDDGSRSEISYRNGAQEGPARDWYPSGILKGESWFRDNVQHGVDREYDEEGNMLSETSFEYGITICKSERNPEGLMIRVFELDETSHNHALLERYRIEKAWPLDGMRGRILE